LIGGVGEEAALMGMGIDCKFVGVAILVLAVIWGINLFNFMDGIDGLAATEAIFIAGAAALFNWKAGGSLGATAAMLCLMTACAGFLVLNWSPASIFMGDVGSGFLGITLVLLAVLISETSRIPIQVWPILGGVFVVDATVTLLRRILRGDKWSEAHRTHAYQHLAARFRSHQVVTLIVVAIDILWLFPWAYYTATREANKDLCMTLALSPLVVAACLIGSGRERDLS
jgi:Fuc2NAc and GlcNAc transferase